MQSSLFRTGPPSSPPLLPRYEHELPILSRSQFTGATAKVPQPVVTFSQTSASTMAPTMKDNGPLLALQRKERQLQRDFQALLDAQSDGLMTGLSSGNPGESLSDVSKSRSLSASGMRASRTVPVRQPAKRRVGLRAARTGILRAMQELAAVKLDEGAVVEGELRARELVLQQVDEWSRKRAGLQKEIRDINGADDGSRVADLRAEDQAVQTEIHELETQLYQLKAKHKHLTLELSQMENSVQARLSSYQASASMVESQIQKFLRDPPIPSPSGRDSPFLSLPPTRRTLEMAKEHWEAEHERRAYEQRQMETERDALEEGAVMWADVVGEVTAFESTLRGELKRGGGLGKTDEILSQMDRTLAGLESKLEVVEKRDWKLLICCIGAELEAFREGRDLLLEALGATRTTDEPGDGTTKGNSAETHDGADHDHGLGELRDDHGGFHDAVERSEDDEDPDPTLMISHHSAG
ncbi:MAG: hypothetical protein M1832_000854 [Thelocarpon impressellum]|nr:MAG: hypothetical protein M1832_000854 [Thelocarpon impressellum]